MVTRELYIDPKTCPTKMIHIFSSFRDNQKFASHALDCIFVPFCICFNPFQLYFCALFAFILPFWLKFALFFLLFLIYFFSPKWQRFSTTGGGGGNIYTLDKYITNYQINIPVDTYINYRHFELFKLSAWPPLTNPRKCSASFFLILTVTSEIFWSATETSLMSS